MRFILSSIRTLIILATITTVGALSSCNNSAKTTDSEIDSLDIDTTLFIGVIPTSDCLPFYVADTCGIFDSLGVKVKLLTYLSAMDCDTALQNGHIDATVSDIVRAYVTRINGDSVKAIMKTDLNLWLVTSKASRLRNLSSLKERIVGITRHSAVDLTADAIMEKAKFESDELNRPQINNVFIRSKMLEQDQYDGAILPEPFASLCETKGCKRIIGTKELKLSLGAVVFREEVLAKKGKEIKKLIKAYDAAVDFINRNNMNFYSMLPDCENINDTIVKRTKFSHASVPEKDMIAIVEKWATGRDFVAEKGFGYSDVVDSSFVK